MTQPLADRIALVTGASRGIGAVTAVALARAGAHVVLVGRTEGGLTHAEEQIHAAGGSATIVPMDITQGEHVDQLAAHVAERWGRLDILVMNAAVLGPLSPLSHVPPKDWDQVIATNLTAGYRLIRDFDALLRASPAGRVVALTSSVATRPRAYWGPYAASKAGLETMLDCYAEEVARLTSVRVAIVNPGATRTAMRKDAFPGEDPATLKPAAVVADAITDLLVRDFETGHRLDLGQKA
ncbi:SDR family NAD(P)-dependent oxidoreductase [Parapedomonas caeni]